MFKNPTRRLVVSVKFSNHLKILILKQTSDIVFRKRDNVTMYEVKFDNKSDESSFEQIEVDQTSYFEKLVKCIERFFFNV